MIANAALALFFHVTAAAGHGGPQVAPTVVPNSCIEALQPCAVAPTTPAACRLCQGKQTAALRAAKCTQEDINTFCRLQTGCSAGLNVSKVDAANFAGRTVLVTGSDGREGFPLTVAAVQAGAKTVIAASYNAATAAKNKARLKNTLGAAASVIETVAFDLSSFGQIRTFATRTLQKYPRIDAIIHIAATLTETPPGGNMTSSGFLSDVTVNIAGPALLTKLLQPALAKAPGVPRVVWVTSANAYDPLDFPDTDRVSTAVAWMRGTATPPALETNPYFFYSFTKFLITQYAAGFATATNAASFSVAPGFFRDDPDK